MTASPAEILGRLAENTSFSVEQTQRDAWLEEIRILRNTLHNLQGMIFFEFSVPRMGRRIDIVLLIDSVVFVLEFKVGEKEFPRSAVQSGTEAGLTARFE